MRAVCVRGSTSCQRVMASRASSHRAFKKLLLGGYCLGVHNLLLVRKLNPVGLFAFVCVWHCCVRCSHASRMVPFFLARRCLNNPPARVTSNRGCLGVTRGRPAADYSIRLGIMLSTANLVALSLSLSRKEKNGSKWKIFLVQSSGKEARSGRNGQDTLLGCGGVR